MRIRTVVREIKKLGFEPTPEKVMSIAKKFEGQSDKSVLDLCTHLKLKDAIREEFQLKAETQYASIQINPPLSDLKVGDSYKFKISGATVQVIEADIKALQALQ